MKTASQDTLWFYIGLAFVVFSLAALIRHARNEPVSDAAPSATTLEAPSLLPPDPFGTGIFTTTTGAAP